MLSRQDSSSTHSYEDQDLFVCLTLNPHVEIQHQGQDVRDGPWRDEYVMRTIPI